MTSIATVNPQTSLVAKFAARYSVEPAKMLATLKQTAFRVKEGEVTNEQMMALLIVADQYRLNPFTKEIYAFPDGKAGGIVPVVGVDGWARILNEDPNCDGIEFIDGPVTNGLPEWIEAVIHRKDRSHPTRAREYMVECKRNTPTWGSHPRRMLRHKALIQCARLAFGFVGIYDEDEAKRIAEGSVIQHDPLPVNAPTETGGVAKLRSMMPAAAEPEQPPASAPSKDGPIEDVPY